MIRSIPASLPWLAAGVLMFFFVGRATKNVMDVGQCHASFVLAAPTWLLMAGMITIRRFRNPTFVDSILLVLGMPLLTIFSLHMLPYVDRLLRIPMTWGRLAELWQ